VTHGPSIGAIDLLRSWRDAGLVAREDLPEIAEAIATAAASDEPPLHLKILAGVGTLVGTLFFLGFLAAADLVSFESGEGLLGWGGGLLAVGIGLSVGLRRLPVGLGHDAVAQIAFVALALGKVAAVAGAILFFGESVPWVATAALAAVTAVTYPVSGSSLDRFLSPCAVAVSVLYEILERNAAGLAAGPGASLFVAAALAVAAALLVSHRVPPALRPIGIAALAAVGTVVAILTAGRDLGIWATGAPIDPRPIEALLALALAAAIARIGFEAGAVRRPPVAAAIGGAVLLGFAGAPGVVFALLLLVAGHARHDTPIRIAGILALPVTLVLWYWARDLDFLAKAAALAGSGAVLLAARGVMARTGWDREGEA
jgi:hypothetical protein